LKGPKYELLVNEFITQSKLELIDDKGTRFKTDF
jgi:hypothetical protein